MAESKPSAPLAKDTLTPAERIAELNEIDQSVSVLLSAAGEAVGVLSNKSELVTEKDLEAAQARFSGAASKYFATLSSIEVRLRRQVYAMEESGLIAAGSEADARKGRQLGADGAGRSGGGPLDPSWLNAKADNGVDYHLEREIVDEAQKFLESTKTDGHGRP